MVGDSAFVSMVEQISPYGPVWMMMAIVVVIVGAVAIALVPAVKERMLEKSKNESEREKRKREEFLASTKHTGQMIECIHESTMAVDRNTDVIQAVLSEMKTFRESTSKMDDKMDMVMDEVKNVRSDISDMKVEMARIHGGA